MKFCLNNKFDFILVGFYIFFFYLFQIYQVRAICYILLVLCYILFFLYREQREQNSPSKAYNTLDLSLFFSDLSCRPF